MISDNIFDYEDVVKYIFNYLPKTMIVIDIKMVSKNFYKYAFDYNKQLVQDYLAPISVFYHYLTSAEKVVEFILKHDLRKINLTYISDLNYCHLRLLAEQQKIIALQIDCNRISNWPKIESLQHLVPENVSGFEMIIFSSVFPNLTRIDLSGQTIKGERFNQLTNLTTINLENSSFGDDDLIAIAKTCHKIHTLRLSHCKVTDIGLVVLLKSCHNIEILNLKTTKVTGECFEEGVFEKLSVLNLSYNKLTNKGYASIGKAFPNLKILDLVNTKTTNKRLSNILRICLKLEEIDLSLTVINNYKLTRILNLGRHLKEVDFLYTYVTDKKIRSLKKTFPNLSIRH